METILKVNAMLPHHHSPRWFLIEPYARPKVYQALEYFERPHPLRRFDFMRDRNELIPHRVIR